MKFNLFPTPRLIGIDIQSDWLKVVILRKTRQAWVLENAGAAQIPPEIVSEGKIRHFDKISAILLDLMRALAVNQERVAISLPAMLVRMQRLTLPACLTEAEIETDILLHLQRDLPVTQDTLCMDYAVISSAGSIEADIFFAAVRQEHLLHYVDCIQTTGLRVKRVDVDVLALLRATHYGAPFITHEGELNALAYINNNMILLIIMDERQIVFHQQWEMLNAADLLLQLKTSVHLCLASQRRNALNKIGMIGMTAEQQSAAEMTKHSWCAEIVFLTPLARFEKSEVIEDALFKANPNAFLIACGTAMQEIPRWL